MYKILIDGNVIYSPVLVDEGYSVLSPKIKYKLNKSGSLEFTVPPDNPMYDEIHKLKSIVTVFDGEEEIFRGRVLHDEKDFYRRKAVYCEGELSFLLDSVQRVYDYTGTLEGLFNQYINNHNDQVEAEKQFTVGTVSVNDNYVHYSSTQYPNTLSEIEAKLIGTHGGYIRTRLDNGTRYIDYISSFSYVSDQTIQFAVNLLDISEFISAEDVFTILIPLGSRNENTERRLTIESVNDGKDYLIDDNAVSLFGRICRTEVWDDVTVASNLLNKGRTRLSEGVNSSVKLSLKAVDLHLLNVDTDRLRIGDNVRVVSTPHHLDQYFQCSEITLDLVNPKNSQYVFGTTYKTMTETQVQNQQQNSDNQIKIIDDARAIASDLIRSALGGVVTITEDASQLLIMDTDDIETAMKVWRWNINGLGYSSTGYDGTYGLAITMDGQISADYITTGHLSADLINAGTMSADRISGGTLTLGGQNDVNGLLEVYNASGRLVSKLDRSGLYSIAGVVGGWDISSSGLSHNTGSGLSQVEVNLLPASASTDMILSGEVGGLTSVYIKANGEAYLTDIVSPITFEDGAWFESPVYLGSGADLSVAGSASFTGSTQVTTLECTSGAVFSPDLTVNGTLNVSGKINIYPEGASSGGTDIYYRSGILYCGYTRQNSVSFVPAQNSSMNLGSNITPWAKLYTNEIKCYGDADINGDITTATVTTTGDIGVGGSIWLGSNSIASNGSTLHMNTVYSSSGAFAPSNTGIDLGTQNNPWNMVYSYLGYTQTSDARLKNSIVDLDEKAVDLIMQVRPVSFALNHKGDQKHYGLIAQEVKQVMDSIGLLPEEFGGYYDDGGMLGLSYSEFIAPLIKAVQELKKELDDLKGRR